MHGNPMNPAEDLGESSPLDVEWLHKNGFIQGEVIPSLPLPDGGIGNLTINAIITPKGVEAIS